MIFFPLHGQSLNHILYVLEGVFVLRLNFTNNYKTSCKKVIKKKNC